MDDSEMDGPVYKKSKISQETAGQDRTVEEDEPYCFSNPRRGVAVVIVYSQDHKRINRPGWQIDQKHLSQTFSHLGFQVRNFEDLSKEDLMKNLKKVSQEDHSDCDCFVLAVSSHGQEHREDGVREDEIVTIDHPVKTREVVDMFTDKACPSLTGKPRICFIQACRGDQLDHGHEILAKKIECHDDTPDASLVLTDMVDVIPVGLIYAHKSTIGHQHTQQSIDINTMLKHLHIRQPIHHNIAVTSLNYQLREVNIPIPRQRRQIIQEDELPEPVVSPAPCHKDFLVMYATPPGYFAFRRPKEGSWFVKSLTEVLRKSDGTRHLTKELTRVIRLVAENYTSSSLQEDLHRKKQTPVIYSMLCKDIYMAPKKTLQAGR